MSFSSFSTFPDDPEERHVELYRPREVQMPKRKAEEPLYRVDRRGDYDNLKYDRSEKGKEPKYHRPPTLILKSTADSGKILEKRRSWKDWEVDKQTIEENTRAVVPDSEGFLSLYPLAGQAPPLNAFLEKQSKLNQAVLLNPADVDCWLELIDFQDQIEAKTDRVIEKKLAIIESALKKNAGDSSLLLLKIRLNAQVKSFDETAHIADRLVAEHPNCLELRLLRLELLQTHSANCLHFLVRKAYQDEASVTSNIMFKLHLFLRVLALDFNSGRVEHALGLLICQLKLCIQTMSLSELEDAWDSGVSLLGEPTEPSEGNPIRAVYASDNVDEDRVVLFDDLKAFIQIPPAQIASDVVSMLLCKLFSMHSGHIPSPAAFIFALNDPLAYLCTVNSPEAMFTRASTNMMIPEALFWRKRPILDLKPSFLVQNVCDYMISKDLCFLPMFLAFFRLTDPQHGVSLLRRLIKQNPSSGFLWKLYVLSESTCSPETAMQICKRLLSQRALANESDHFGILREYVSILLLHKVESHEVLTAIMDFFGVEQSEIICALDSRIQQTGSLDLHFIKAIATALAQSAQGAVASFPPPDGYLPCLFKSRLVSLLQESKLITRVEANGFMTPLFKQLHFDSFIYECYIKTESSFVFARRTERLLTQQFKRKDKFVRTMFELEAASERHASLIDKLQAAIESYPTSYTLHLAYLKALVSKQNASLSLKAAFFTALRSCPLVRELYTLATNISNLFTPHEQADIQQMLRKLY